MDKIIRIFKKEISETFTLHYPFTTYSCVLEPAMEPLLNYLGHVFTMGREIPEVSVSDYSKKKKFMGKVEKVAKADFFSLAKKLDYEGMGNKQHEFVENAFLNEDTHTVAVEVPVGDSEMGGFIDIVRLKDGVVQVLDFKPKANKEKYAAIQVYTYMNLLKQNAPDIEKIEGFYFDNKHCYKVFY